MADITTNTPVQAGPSNRIQAAFKFLATRFAQHRVYRETMNELQGLSSRELADLGLHRSEVRRVAYHAAYN